MVKAEGREPDRPSELVTVTVHRPGTAPVKARLQVIFALLSTTTLVAVIVDCPVKERVTAAPAVKLAPETVIAIVDPLAALDGLIEVTRGARIAPLK